MLNEVQMLEQTGCSGLKERITCKLAKLSRPESVSGAEG
jgi:hypothetical protein